MPGPKPAVLTLTDRQRAILQSFARSTTLAHAHVQRARLILAATEPTNNTRIARRLGLDRDTVRLWRTRWQAATATLAAQEAADPADAPLRSLIQALLTDAPRCGAPPTFTPEQVVQIVALACED